jgi:hypothetical protein
MWPQLIVLRLPLLNQYRSTYHPGSTVPYPGRNRENAISRTDLNANVIWELGVRQSFDHCTITISEDVGKHLPFDLGVKGTLYYSGNP